MSVSIIMIFSTRKEKVDKFNLTKLETDFVLKYPKHKSFFAVPEWNKHTFLSLWTEIRGDFKIHGCCFPSKIKNLWCYKPLVPLVGQKTCALNEILTRLVINENAFSQRIICEYNDWLFKIFVQNFCFLGPVGK